MVIALAFLALLTAVLLGFSRGEIRPFHVTLGTLAVVLVGYGRIADDSPHGEHHLHLLIGAIVALVFGYLVGEARTLGAARPEVRPSSASERWALARTAQVVVALGVFHFARVGVPLLSAAPERDRWNFTGSGLLGLPGRSEVFAIVIVLALAFALTRGDEPARARSLVLLPVGALVAFRLAGGFKGGLLQLVVQLAFVQLSLRPPQQLGAAARRYGAWLGIALLFAAGVAALYQTTADREDDLLGLVIDRATLVPAEEGSQMLELTQRGTRIAPTNTIARDFRTLAMEYLPGFGGERHQFIAVYSAHRNGRSLIGDQFIVPVTPGGFPVLYYNFGLRAWGAMFLVGVAYGLLEGLARSSSRATVATLGLVGCLVLHYFLVKGDLAFVTINWGVMTVFVLGLYTTLRTFHAGRPEVTAPVGGGELLLR